MGTVSTARNGFSQITRRLAIPGLDRQDNEVDALQLVSEHLSSEKHGSWLLVLDNTDDADVLFSVEGASSPSAQAKSLASCLPRNKNGRILVTTRDRRVGEILCRDSLLDVDIPALLDASLLLRSKLHEDRWDEAQAKELVTSLGHLPLAVAQAAAFINQNNIKIEEYLRCLRAGDAGIKELLEIELYDLRRYDAAQVSVLQTWKLSFDLIKKQEPRAMKILSLMAVLHSQMVPKSLLCKPNESPVSFITTVGTLQAFSLVTAVRGDEKLSMHPLVHLAARAQLEREGNLLEYQEEALSLLADQFPVTDFENWEACEALLPHFHAIYDFVPLCGTPRLQKVKLTLATAELDRKRSRYADAWQKLEHCLTLRESIVGDASPTLAAVWNSIGEYKLNQVDAYAAEAAFQRAYDLCTETVAQDFDTCNSLLGISSSKAEQGDYLGAKETVQRALDFQIATLGEDHELTLIMQRQLVTRIQLCGEYDSAEIIQRRVLAAQEMKWGRSAHRTQEWLFELADTLLEKGNHSEAEQIYKEILTFREETLGDNHPSTLMALVGAAQSLLEQGKHEESEVLFRQHMIKAFKVWGKDHPKASKSIQRLATAFSRQKKFEEAGRLLMNAIDISAKSLGAEYSETLEIKADLAKVLQCQGKSVEAEALFRYILPIQEKTLGLRNAGTQ